MGGKVLNNVDAVGLEFGLLKIVGRGGVTSRNHTLWKCLCACGKETLAEMDSLRVGKKKSCGCLKSSNRASVTHGACVPGADPEVTRAFRIWAGIRKRCNNPRDRAYKWYGGRGVTICSEWDNFSAFLADMGPCKPGFSIERRKVHEGYCAKNCYWLIRNKQQENKQNTLRVMYKGQVWRFKALCTELNLRYLTVYKRHFLRGWSLQDSFETLDVNHYIEKTTNENLQHPE